ncbi:MAG: c-type cytochrome, partial [Chloroflexota bacterium]
MQTYKKYGCYACHTVDKYDWAQNGGGGPTHNGMARTAATRVPGLSAEEYIRQSILDPGAFTVPGFEDKAEVMPRDFKDKLTPEEIDILVNFLAQQK